MKIELNTIYNMDCLEGMKAIPDGSVDCVLTDPPYLFVKGGMKNPKWNTGKMAAESYMNKEMADFDGSRISEMLDAIAPKFKHGWNAYFYCSEMQIVYYMQYAIEHKLRYNLLIWDREVRKMISKKFYRSNIDYIVRIYGKGNSLNNVEGNTMDLYSKIRIAKQPNETGHETEKPISHFCDFIKLSSNEGDVILDPFMGSGTTAIACIKEKRNYIGFELNEEYYRKSLDRIQRELSQPSLF